MIPMDPFLECFYEHKIRYIGYQGKSIIFKDYYKHVCFKICDIVTDVSLLAYWVIWSSGRSSNNYHTHGYECNDISRYLHQEWCGGVCVLSHVRFCSPMDCSPPGSSIHGIFQVRILEWIAISYSRGSAWPRDRTHVAWVSCTSRQILYHCATWEVHSKSNMKTSAVLIGDKVAGSTNTTAVCCCIHNGGEVKISIRG